MFPESGIGFFIANIVINIVSFFVCILIFSFGTKRLSKAKNYEFGQKFYGWSLIALAFATHLLLSHWTHM